MWRWRGRPFNRATLLGDSVGALGTCGGAMKPRSDGEELIWTHGIDGAIGDGRYLCGSAGCMIAQGGIILYPIVKRVSNVHRLEEVSISSIIMKITGEKYRA